MSSSLVELRPNRRLLDYEFEGYKLNLQALPHYSLELANPVDRMLPDDAYYSFVHAKIFALHNHLILDYWDHSFSFYYVDNNQQIRRITFENVNHTFQNNIVYDIPAHVERKSGHFNLCLTFPSCNLAVVSDGTGYLHIVDTGQRNRPTDLNQMWNTLQSSLILGENKYFIIVDARLHENNGKKTLHCLLQSVEQNEKHFNSVLSWVSFDFDGSWKQTSFRQIQGKGTIHYAAIETNCTALYIASDNIFKFTMDSEREIKEPSSEDFKKIIYTWLQTSDDVTVTLKLEENFDKKNLNIIVTPNVLKVRYAEKAFVEGSLRYKVDSELTTWNVQENGQIDILITKLDSILWDELLEGGDPNGEQIMDPSLVEETHRRLAHLCSETEVSSDQSVPGLSTQELEDCDTVSEEDTVLVRIDVITHQVTHRIPLSIHQFLCSIKMETQEVPALALRHDVDACIWQPYAQLINSDTWPVKHQGTLMAFGYIQSSKQNRKFVTCPPNFSYSVVCESSRHIFIYQSVSNQDCQLRKRTSGVMKNIKVGQQHVFNIDKYGEVLGVNATNEFLFILTDCSLIAIKIL